MKNIILLTVTCWAAMIFAQTTNTFPTSGNVGIGTTNPQEKLHVNGNIRINDFKIGRYGRSVSGNPDPYHLAFFGKGTNDLIVYGSKGAATLNLRLVDGALKMGFKPTPNAQINNNGSAYFNGNIGIGTTSPQAKLHVNGNIKVGGYIQGNARGNATRIKSSFGYIDIGAVNAGRAHFHTDRSHYYFDKSIITQGSGFYTNLNTLHLGIQKRAGSGFSYQNNLTLTADNKVGIGTTKPDQKLTVKGKIHAEEVIVDLSVPADYVFEKHYTGTSRLKPSYKMPSLKEVSAYTKKHKHLPGIPSAKELKKQGMKLSEMTNLLLQKIEELTLYILQQQKEIEALKQKNK